MLKASDLRELDRDELRDKERELSQELFTLRLQMVTGQLESPARVKETKKDLARVLTVLRQQGQTVLRQQGQGS